jgi:hypothetical protein
LGKDFAQAPAAPYNRLQERVFGELKLAHIGFIETAKTSPLSRYTPISVNVRGKVGHYAHVSPQFCITSRLITELVNRPESMLAVTGPMAFEETAVLIACILSATR